MTDSFALYLHIPFCLHKCPYCDFNTYAVTNLPEKEYVSALLAELDFRAALAEWSGRTISSIYFGGGTPSLLNPRSIERIINFTSRLFPVSDQVEISMEANPGTVDADSLTSFHSAGVNRLSFGVQSFDRDILQVLGRMHSPEQSEAAFNAAREAGFSNLSLDLIYGVPKQKVGNWEEDLQQACALAPEHISTYGLTVEKGTPFYQSYKRGLLKLPPEQALLEMMDCCTALLNAHGYRQYEISNFSKPGKEARHNLAYWNGSDYLGLGAGAHSFVRLQDSKHFGRRWSNYALPNKYMKEAIAHGQAQSWQDNLSIEAGMFEFFFLGLRKISGVSFVEFKQRFGCEAKQACENIVQMLSEQGLLLLEEENIRLTEQGLKLADSVIEHFVDLNFGTPAKTPEHAAAA